MLEKEMTERLYTSSAHLPQKLM